MGTPKKEINFKRKSQQSRKKRLLLHQTLVYSTMQMKKHLFYTFLFIFVITAVVALLGITGVITIRDQYLAPLFGALLIELVGAVIALFRTAKFFDEPLHPENPSPSAKLTPAHVAVRPAIPTAMVSKSQPPIASVVLRSQAVDDSELDVTEFFVKYGQLQNNGRFLERDKLKAEIKGKRVVFRGVVSNVTEISGKTNVFLSDDSPKIQNSIFHNVVVLVDASQRAEAYSLRKGDMLEVRGIADTGGETYVGIEKGSFKRMDAKQV